MIDPHTSQLEPRFFEVRRATESLREPLSAEDCQVQSMEDASPTKWHLAHTSWFFETFVLEPGLAGYRSFHPDYRFLFNSYYNTVGEQYPRPKRGLLTRPSLDEVARYRVHVDEHMARLLSSDPTPELAAVVELGLHHEQQHQELILTDIKHMLGGNPLRPAYKQAELEGSKGKARTEGWRAFEAGIREIGHAGSGFSFDNELPRHRVFGEAYELALAPSSNGDFLAFMQDGGYQRPDLWLSNGWAAVQAQAWSSPLYWEQRDGVWMLLTLTGLREVDPHAPVCHINHYEADAFARWSGARLPTEAEWEVAAFESGAAVKGSFVESGALQPSAAREPAPGEFSQLFGDVWEWTQSSYGAYPGYKPGSGALGEYNGKFMSSQMVLRGGSCVTPQEHTRVTYRNFFPPDARWQFSGVRLARDA